MTTTYFIAPSVHWCTLHGFTVVLDVVNDKYLSIPAAQFEALLPFLASGAASGASAPRPKLPAELQEFARELADSRVLVTQSPHRDIEPIGNVARPTRVISSAEGLPPFTRALPYLPAFIRACVIADYTLRYIPLHKTIARISQRKRRYCGKGKPTSEALLETLTRRFYALRLLYPRAYLCLFDSLALIEFLSSWALLPDWVFGVCVDPFRAHCWVQHNGLVLCDTLQFSARWFRPIMVI
jgi:hypothetical protein